MQSARIERMLRKGGMYGMITKKDIAVIAALLIAAALLYVALSGREKGGILVIKKDGQVCGRYSLKEDRSIKIGKTNVVEIKNGKAFMRHADCPDQICVRHRAICLDGESIVCLPNRVVVEVHSDKASAYDGVTN